MRLGTTEMMLILAIALVVFGSSRLSGLGKALGTSVREFKAELGAGNVSNPVEGGDNHADSLPIK